MRHSERMKPICSQTMETFLVQHADTDHAIKEALVLFTKHLFHWAWLQPVRTIKNVNRTGLHIAFYYYYYSSSNLPAL